MMEASEGLQMFLADPFFAAITRVALQRDLSIFQPAAQRFGIDTQARAGLGEREDGHKGTPFG